MFFTTSTATRKHQWAAGLCAAVFMFLSGTTANAEPPEAWEAYDDERVLTGSSHAFFRFNPAPGVAGPYVISAKLNIRSNTQVPPPLLPAGVTCRLSATSGGSNWDFASGSGTVYLSVAHRATISGPRIELDCYHTGQVAWNSSTILSYVKITAVRVNTLTYVPL